MAASYVLSPSAFLYHADCREALRALPDNSIDSVCTDPPYALVSIVKRFGGPNAAPAKGNDAYMRASAGFMGRSWDTGETAFSVEFWAQVLRVLKPGGHVAAFGATRGYHRMACAIEDAGFEIRDSLAWMYGTGFPKSQNVSKFIDTELGAVRDKVRHAPRPESSGTFAGAMDSRPWIEEARRVGYHEVDSDVSITPEAQRYEGFGTALKPAFEPIVLARKPLSEKTVAANVLRWGTGALNIGACRVGEAGGTRKANCDSKVKESKTISAYGNGLNGGGVAAIDAGRWPANVCHDGSAEVIDAFPDAGGGFGKRGGNKSLTSYGFEQGTMETVGYGDSGSAARFFYSSKATKADRNGSKHPTVKPIKLMQWLARLITPPGGAVLDPFAGSGTTGAACALEGFNCVMIEREAEYVGDIIARFTAPDTHTHTYIHQGGGFTESSRTSGANPDLNKG